MLIAARARDSGRQLAAAALARRHELPTDEMT